MSRAQCDRGQSCLAWEGQLEGDTQATSTGHICDSALGPRTAIAGNGGPQGLSGCPQPLASSPFPCEGLSLTIGAFPRQKPLVGLFQGVVEGKLEARIGEDGQQGRVQATVEGQGPFGSVHGHHGFQQCLIDLGMHTGKMGSQYKFGHMAWHPPVPREDKGLTCQATSLPGLAPGQARAIQN